MISRLLIAGARLRPGDTVIEIGAGSCWLSHLLNRYGCRTIAVDVSPTALAPGWQNVLAEGPTRRYELPARDIGRFWVAGGSAVTGWPAS